MLINYSKTEVAREMTGAPRADLRQKAISATLPERPPLHSLILPPLPSRLIPSPPLPQK